MVVSRAVATSGSFSWAKAEVPSRLRVELEHLKRGDVALQRHARGTAVSILLAVVCIDDPLATLLAENMDGSLG